MNGKYDAGIGAKIVVEAARFVGLTEIKSNAAWDDLETKGHDSVADALKEELLRVGWEVGWPYCAAFCEAVWRRAYAGRPELPTVRTMLNPACVSSFHNAAAQGWTEKTPRIGSIGIMKKGTTANGHAFIVRAISGTKLYTIEANTSPNPGTAAADREGDGVYAKTRQLIFGPTAGLHLIGFITPMVIS